MGNAGHAIALVLAGLACAAPATEPGRRAPAAEPLALELALLGDPLAVGLALAFPGDDDGETVVRETEAWGGVGPDREDLVDVRFEVQGGGEAAAERVERHAWRVSHPPGARLVLRGVVPQNGEDRRASFVGNAHYRPILEPGLMHLIGDLLLPMPEHLDPDVEREVELSYVGFAEGGWRIADSFGVGPGPRTVRASAGELQHALFVAGDVDVETRDAAGNPVVVALAGGGWSFGADELADVAAEIVALERELLEDPGPRHYLIGAIAVGEPQRGLSLGGTGLTNAFALFLQPNADLALGAPGGLAIRRVLAHECFHEWNGIRIRLAAPEERLYWFSEGFTDFFARRVLRAAGWLDDEAYAADLSAMLADYHTSPARNLPAAELAEAFWTDRDAGRQPYLRGDLVACALDHAIRERSGGERDLADLMRALLAEAEADGTRFDAETLLARFAAWAGDEVAAALRAVVVDGETAVLPPDAFGPRLEVEDGVVHAWDPGFDVDATRERMAVTGLRPGSPAAEAGLTEDLPLAGLSVHYDDPDRELELVPRAPGATPIRFLPRGEPLPVPVVRVREP